MAGSTDRRTVVLGVIALALTGALLFGPGSTVVSAYDFTVTPRTTGWSALPGGEFDMQTAWTGYATALQPYYNTSAFTTFCLQNNQYWTPGGTYFVTLSDQTNHGDQQKLPSYAAYLFHVWNQGQLSQYRYSGSDQQRKEDAGQLQKAFWYLMGKAPKPADGTKAAAWLALPYDGWTGIGNVRVMQLYDANNGDHQDMLVELVPEPSSLCLLALGALGLVRRRKR